MTGPDPTLRPVPRPEDKIGGEADRALRPQQLSDFIGQAEARANLRVFIESARQRGEAMDHALFHGPPPAWAKPRWHRSWRASLGG